MLAGENITAGERSIRLGSLRDQVDEAEIIQKRIQDGIDAHKRFSNTIDGEFIADSYGNMKFRAIDENGFVIPNKYLDANIPQSSVGGGRGDSGPPEYYHSQ